MTIGFVTLYVYFGNTQCIVRSLAYFERYMTEVFISVYFDIVILWIMPLGSLVGGYERFK
jgi:hypothetical protein